ESRRPGPMRLTDKMTASLALPPGSKDAVFWDDDIAGFGIRIREGGSRNWIYRYRIGARQRSVILGSAKSVPLSVARKNASLLEAQVRLGKDPAGDRENAKIEASNTVAVLVEQYLEVGKSNWRQVTYADVKRYLTRYAKPLHRLPVASVSQRSVANLLNDIAKEHGDVTANRVRASLCTLFTWAIREGIRLPEGNVASLTAKRKEKSRDRV